MLNRLPPQGILRRGLRKLAAPARSERFRKAVSRMRRDLTPISDDVLRRTLIELIGDLQEVMLVHSSLSSCGRFTAGPERVLGAIGDQADTLVLVTHSYCYPEVLGEPGPVFDPATTPSQNGALTNLFRTTDETFRSLHATHSLAARGPLAEWVTAAHDTCETPTGEGTPYLRLVQRKASALMFGVTFHSYTFFHTAEFVSGSDRAYQHGVIDKLRVRDASGLVHEHRSKRQNWEPMRFAEAGDLMEQMGLVRSIGLGRNRLRFVPDTSKAHDFLVDRLRKTPDFLRQSCPIDLY